MIKIEIDSEKCTGCDRCVQLCPMSVFETGSVNGQAFPKITRVEDCCACMTCSGKCPESAIAVLETPPVHMYADAGNTAPFIPLSREQHIRYKNYAETLDSVLKLRWKPVAVTLIPKGGALPHIPIPRTRLRYCQALIMARRGKKILMPPSSHACPDGTSILGLTKIPEKLATGDIYHKLGKLATVEAAKTLVRERPALPEKSICATLVTPLDDTVMKPDVVAVIAPPETMMWLCMSSTFFSGKRSTFRMGSYNAQCLETTLYPYTRGELSLSLGCYGCRAISDLSDDLMFMGIPIDKMDQMMEGLIHLGRKAIADGRSKVYLPPLV